MEAVLTWLKDAGFQAVRRMPEGEFPELSGAVVAVVRIRKNANEMLRRLDF